MLIDFRNKPYRNRKNVTRIMRDSFGNFNKRFFGVSVFEKFNRVLVIQNGGSKIIAIFRRFSGDLVQDCIEAKNTF